MSLKKIFQPDDFELSDLNDLFGSENHSSSSSSANKISLAAYKNQNDEDDDLDIDENLFSKKGHDSDDSEFQINFQPRQPVQNRKPLTEQHINNVLLKSAFNPPKKPAQPQQNPNQHLTNRPSASTSISQPEQTKANPARLNLSNLSINSTNASSNKPNLQKPLKPVAELRMRFLFFNLIVFSFFF